MADNKPKRNPKQLHEGMSYGICVKCSQEFKLRRKTKHSHAKKVKGICPNCGTKTKRK